MINTTACYLRKDDETLFLHRAGGESDIHHGFYVPPVGKVKRGERGIDCIRREFREETGLTLIDPKLRIIATFYNKGRILGGKKNPKDWHVEFYEARGFAGNLKEENSDAMPVWIRNNDLPNIRMHEADRTIFRLLDEEGIFEVVVKYSGENLTSFRFERVY